VTPVKVRPFLHDTLSIIGADTDDVETYREKPPSSKETSESENSQSIKKIDQQARQLLPRKVDIVLSDRFKSILQWLVKDSLPLFGYLKENKCIHKDVELLSMEVGQARFLCKEDEKRQEMGIEGRYFF